MAITSRKITTYAKNIVDLSDQPNKDGLTAAQLKAMFDGRTDEEVKTSINGIVDDLTATTDGASGADQVGATAVGDGTAVTVQGILEEQDAKSDTIDGLVVHKADAETITGVKTFSVSPIVPAPTTDTQASTKKYVDDTDGARKTYVDNLDALAVHLAGNETITGIKTFSASPVVPAPTTDTQAATKKYVDDADALKVDITDIVNDLTTGGTAVPLSAEQGKTLQGEVGTLASLSTTEKGSLVGAINEVDDHADTNATSIGTLASLTTTEKTNLVGAINEVDADVGTNATAIGTLASLTTTEKTNLVGAINELDTDKVETSAIANTLTETAAGKVLDARQGKALSDKIGTQTYTEDNYITDSEPLTESVDKLDMAVKDNADLISTNTGNISTNTTFRTKLETYMGNFIEDFLPYGVSWDKGETPTLTRTDFAEGMTAAIGIDDQVVTNNFDTAPIYREIHDVVDTLGNVFVRIPKFYIKKTDGVGSKTWSISKYKHQGFYLPWCFWDFANSRELPYIDVGKYNASLNGTKLASVANTYPLINKNIVELRGYAQANNAGGLLGYQQLDVHVIDILRTLFFIEFGTLNSQAIMKGYTEGQYTANHLATATETGANRIVVANAHADLYRVGQAISVGTTQGGNQKFYGRTITGITVVDGSNKAIEFDGDPVDIATGNMLYNTGWKAGFSSNITASSGCIVANDGKYPCSYRGIENPFGSVWQFVDGVNITDNQAWVAKNAANYASNVFASPYEKLSYVNHNANGYGPVEMGFDSNLPFAEFATNVTGGSTAKHYCDYYYQAAGSRIARFGGSWVNGLDAGLSSWLLTHDSSSTYITFGGRLVRKPL